MRVFFSPLESLFLNIYQYTNDFNCWNSPKFPFTPISFFLYSLSICSIITSLNSGDPGLDP